MSQNYKSTDLSESTLIDSYLPDHYHANTTCTIVGRVWLPKVGPALVLLHEDEVIDITAWGPTMSELLEREDLPSLKTKILKAKDISTVAKLSDLISQSLVFPKNSDELAFLAPCDLQAIKACGVTFAISMIERVIEERAGGDKNQASTIRKQIESIIKGKITDIVPGSPGAAEIKEFMKQAGLWSQYLEVGIGPYAEVFTKAQPLSAVGLGSGVGILPFSKWNNPEPEIVLVINSRAQVVGASLGNDVNLRDIEGLSALLLGKAKDNNASCSIGPWIRVFDENFPAEHALKQIKNTVVDLHIKGEDGFTLSKSCAMSQITRDPKDLVKQVMGEYHSYPDGCMLFLGTLFAPVDDRDEPGLGFTHKINDVVDISCPLIGKLTNTVHYAHKLPPWNFGAGQLMKNLASRKLR